VPAGSGQIQFRKKSKEGWDEWSVNSQTGKMVLFNSNVEHAVGENNSNDDRISLAFNLYTLPLKLDMDSTGYSSNKFFL
jgi:ectoine hydroxylase-related dioxygenase (phytanoyl-CoA dioxygenase family)